MPFEAAPASEWQRSAHRCSKCKEGSMTRRALYYAIPLLFAVALLIAVWFARNRNPSGAMGQANIGQTSCDYCSIGTTDRLALVLLVDETDRSPPRGMGGAAPFHTKREDNILANALGLARHCLDRSA